MKVTTLSVASAMYLVHNHDSKYNTQSEKAATSTTASITATEVPAVAASKSNKSPYQGTNSHIGIIETDFTEKLAAKPYLSYNNPYSRDSIITSTVNTSKKIWNKISRNDRNPNINVQATSFDDDNGIGLVGGGGKGKVERPKGVPKRIRILAIDVPEFREVFDGECRVILSRIYPDDIAPPKYIPRKNSRITEDANDKDKNTKIDDKMEIIQKSLARSLVRCRNVKSKRIGVELLEASVYDLNPHNMRRTYQLGSYKYDPGKYGSMKKMPGDDMLQRQRTNNRMADESKTNESDENMETPGDVNDVDQSAEIEGRKKHNIRREVTVLASDDDEVDAPWNQYAWIEEMELRIKGHVPFGANAERSSWISRKIFGKSYRTTTKKIYRSPLLWFVPSFLVKNLPGGEDGIDGEYQRKVNRASSKPHAVIADGSAMQRVPGSLRYLTTCCQEADVPLFIINDPRVWGGNTHRDLESAAKDVRKTIKNRIVANALAIKEGSMFERGRLLGRLETETKWQIKDAGRRTREAVQDASARLKREREEDWSELGSDALLQRLVERNVLTVQGGKLKDAGTLETFGELCKQYYLDKNKKENMDGKGKENQDGSKTEGKSDVSTNKDKIAEQ